MDAFYYARLAEIEKNIYKDILSRLKNYRNILKGKYSIFLRIGKDYTIEEVGEFVNNAVESVRKDYPEIFYVDFLNYFLIYENGKYRIDMDTLYDAECIQKLMQRIISIKNQIKKEIKADTIEKTELNLYEYLRKRVSYKKTGKKEEATIIGCLINRECICEGVAHTWTYLCRELYIPCITVFGKTKHLVSGKGGNHAWNMVQIGKGNKGVKCLDLTYDLNSNEREYFNLSSKIFSIDHIPDIVLPSCG